MEKSPALMADETLRPVPLFLCAGVGCSVYGLSSVEIPASHAFLGTDGKHLGRPHAFSRKLVDQNIERESQNAIKTLSRAESNPAVLSSVYSDTGVSDLSAFETSGQTMAGALLSSCAEASSSQLEARWQTQAHCGNWKVLSTADRNLVCDVCCMVFSDISVCRRHRRMHLDYSQFSHECHLCSRKFYRKDALSSHLRNGHKLGKQVGKWSGC